jgi:RNA polymerase sigma-70 factor (ECF subfamily)
MTDPDLWRQLRAGDRTALEQIYRQHIALLLQYGGKFVPDGQLVEDCVQDLFVDIWRRRESLSDTDSIRAYLLVALRRRVIRQLGRDREHLSGAGPEAVDFRAEPAIDQQLIDRELAEEQSLGLRTAMEQLSDRQREILYLKYYAGMDYDAIGEIMSLNYQSARNLVSRALARLKELLVVAFFILFWKILTGC